MSIGVVAVILLGTLLYEGQNLQSQLSFYQEKEASLTNQIEDEHERTKEIDQTKAYMETDEYAEEVARNKLGLVKDNEVVFEEKE
ncbi:MAG: FtsB family cell division protein [Blautia sp.]